ncbi:hypothetical protein PHISCL_00732 [Aspergillus sclerotialis]|uniref:SMODS and SLOG-associating 2TM effector domain-containing protein n=1 Tax=Aspergillus sclerotialis TaxID=2070753 RepID=A0A3A3AAB2_9EURO|nr:hypothetical protein PHISCL_00732 [Aspergillus sclerotialis]
MDHVDREEKGFPPINYVPPGNAPVGESSHHILGHHGQPRPKGVALTDKNLLIPPNDKLLAFRALTGIDSAPLLFESGHVVRTAKNIGIYKRVVDAEALTSQRARFFSILINTCLGIQIVVSAALTALGAASGPHSAVTTFGAINTIMAGILTYLKGSGLPDRIKRYKNEWRNLREHIEQREREFCLEDCELSVDEEVITIQTMYEEIKQQTEATKAGGENHKSMVDSSRRSFYPPRRVHVCSHCRQREEPESPISVPERSLDKEKH